MASLFLGCGALLSDRLSKKRSARRESKREYDENFENLKAENMRRESWIQRKNTSPPTLNGMYNTAYVPSDRPPSYDDIAVRKSMDMNEGTSNEGSSRPLLEQRILERSTDISRGQRIETRDMALGRS